MRRTRGPLSPEIAAKAKLVPGRERGEDRDGHELIDAEDAAAEVFERGPEDGGAENERADQAAAAGDGGAQLEPIDDEGVDDENDADEGLPEADRGMLVIMAAGAGGPMRMLVLVLVLVVVIVAAA